MKKILILTLALILLALTLSSCQEDTIETNPQGQLPTTYEMVYEIRHADGTVSQCIGGRDAQGNIFYCDINGQKIVFQSKKVQLSNNLYRQLYNIYALNPETDQYVLIEEDGYVSRRNFEDFYMTAYNASQQGSYKPIEALTKTDGVNSEPLFLDPERFDYFSANTPYGGSFEVAVEKATGICFYACYDNGYSFALVQYTTPYTGDYSDLLPEDGTQSSETDTQPSEDETQSSETDTQPSEDGTN